MVQETSLDRLKRTFTLCQTLWLGICGPSFFGTEVACLLIGTKWPIIYWDYVTNHLLGLGGKWLIIELIIASLALYDEKQFPLQFDPIYSCRWFESRVSFGPQTCLGRHWRLVLATSNARFVTSCTGEWKLFRINIFIRKFLWIQLS